MDVDYGLDVPIFPDEFYTVRNSLRLVDEIPIALTGSCFGPC